FGGSYYFAGDFREGLRIWTEHHERSQRRDDVLHQAWGHGGCALNLFRLGHFPETILRAEQAMALFESNKDRISEIMVQGVLAVARLRQSDVGGATDAANGVWQKIRELGRPTSYLLLEGYSAVIEVHLALAQTAKQETDRRKHIAIARSAWKAMKTYARIFPIGGPRLHYWQGHLALQTRSVEKAIPIWRRGLQIAEQLNMCYEQALAHGVLAKHIPDSHVQSIHRQRALDLFQQCDASYDI
ncbi:MAG: hypothetical protein KDA84_24500, partial [Planctomycetaceae bacterium]|nr:hypothetical protein [Planctomycetaceae bacterium]